ncbi:MAG: HAMP domain-containing histidine kinase [Patescibacteria group bacterium]|nr:HAMP domain-containing histidine kinase [Patescibacteria group bacterium]MDE1944232.1 HAMP domain-containing histidine kinase [Patescibacteria group bacterium]MDE2057810.1 HAMP domain-containing histidine kinase [Patescibacteria group bacterium]
MTRAAFALLAGLAAAGALLALALRSLRRETAALRAERAERKAALAKTSKLLIDKNMELFDQNVAQQEEIARKEDFIEILSHQLRTPATEVRWGLGALGAEMKKNGRGGLELAYFEKLEASAERMVALIDGLVRLMSLEGEGRRPAVEPYAPDEVVAAAAAAAAARFADKKIALESKLAFGGSITSIDRDALGLVADNLIANAYEYTPDGGRVTISTEQGAEGGFALSVADTGVGISEARRPTMFVKFERGEAARTMNKGGMGLGLYLVKNIVEKNGGTIGFESAGEGKGTTFRVALPAKRKTA